MSQTAPLPPLQEAANDDDMAAAVALVRRQAVQAHRVVQAHLPMWVVFGPGTSDVPGLFLARLWVTRPEPAATALLIRAGTLEQLRILLPPGLVCLPRAPDDDPNIIETWI